MSYQNYFKLCIRHRKMKLLRFIFSLQHDFEFSTKILIIALEEDAYDIAVLLYQEYNYQMRVLSNNDQKIILIKIVSGLNKTTN